MVRGQWFPVGGDIELPLSLRQSVLGSGWDALDELSQQIVVFAQERPVGAARLWWAEGAFHLGCVGVLKDERGKGFGDLLMRLLLFKALSHGATLIALDAPPDIAPFFSKYGFVAAREATPKGLVPMSLRGADVHLSHCGGDCAACKRSTAECPSNSSC